MKAPQVFSLSIPTPCQEDWDDMTPFSGSRHCAACQKTVVDFSGWSDAAIAAFFSNPRNNQTCGRFTTQQLEQTYLIPHQPTSKLYRWVMAAGIASITLSVADARAQHVRPDSLHAWSHSITAPDSADAQPEAPVPVFCGTVTDSKGEPLINAMVQVQHAGVTVGKAITDLDGNFSIDDSLLRLHADSAFSIHVSYIGFITYKGPLSLERHQQIRLKSEKGLNRSQSMTYGLIIVTNPARNPPLLDVPGKSTLTSDQIERMH